MQNHYSVQHSQIVCNTRTYDLRRVLINECYGSFIFIDDTVNQIGIKNRYKIDNNREP